MARVHKSIPQPKVSMVQTESTAEETYDVYLSMPELIGTVFKITKYSYRTSDGVEGHLNFPAAVAHMLMARGQHELAANVSQYMTTRSGVRRIQTGTKVNGTALIAAGSWLQFCLSRSLNPADTAAFTKDFSLTIDERKKWGV